MPPPPLPDQYDYDAVIAALTLLNPTLDPSTVMHA